jgi:hypothetical protein
VLREKIEPRVNTKFIVNLKKTVRQTFKLLHEAYREVSASEQHEIFRKKHASVKMKNDPAIQ